jgi:hypothetical protein
MSSDYRPSTNQYGITSPSLDFEGHAGYVPESKIWHGLSIAVGSGNNQVQVGRLQTWSPDAMTRAVVQKYELSAETYGRPVESVPGRAEGYTISTQRVELWENEFEKALGYPDVFADLMDMRWAVDLYEYLYKGKSLYRLWKYPVCWMGSLQEIEKGSDGDGIITASANFTYLPRIKII